MADAAEAAAEVASVVVAGGSHEVAEGTGIVKHDASSTSRSLRSMIFSVELHHHYRRSTVYYTLNQSDILETKHNLTLN